MPKPSPHSVRKAKESILGAMGQFFFGGIGVSSLAVDIVAVKTGYSKTTSSFIAAVKELKNEGILAQRTSNIELTEEGKQRMARCEKPVKDKDIQKLFLEVILKTGDGLPPAPKTTAIFHELLDGKPHTKDELADVAGYKCTATKALTKLWSHMKTFGLLKTISGKGQVQATEKLLFPIIGRSGNSIVTASKSNQIASAASVVSDGEQPRAPVQQNPRRTLKQLEKLLSDDEDDSALETMIFTKKRKISESKNDQEEAMPTLGENSVDQQAMEAGVAVGAANQAASSQSLYDLLSRNAAFLSVQNASDATMSTIKDTEANKVTTAPIAIDNSSVEEPKPPALQAATVAETFDCSNSTAKLACQLLTSPDESLLKDSENLHDSFDNNYLAQTWDCAPSNAADDRLTLWNSKQPKKQKQQKSGSAAFARLHNGDRIDHKILGI